MALGPKSAELCYREWLGIEVMYFSLPCKDISILIFSPCCVFFSLKVLLEIMHPEFAMVFPSLLSYVRLSIRLVRIIFFPLLPLGAVTVPSTSLSENWHCFVIFNYHAREWVPPLFANLYIKVKPCNTGPNLFWLLPKENISAQKCHYS